MSRQMLAQMLALSLGFAALILATRQAGATGTCAPRAGVLAQLAQTYGETRRSLGVAGPQAVVEVFANTATGTWTITATLPDGTMCLVASGQGFDAVADPLPAAGDPA